MLATQKGRSKPSRISWSRWPKLIAPPGGSRRDDNRSEGGGPSRKTLGRSYSHPGFFGQRVRKRLKTKELIFHSVQKGAQELERKGLRSRNVGKLEGPEGASGMQDAHLLVLRPDGG